MTHLLKREMNVHSLQQRINGYSHYQTQIYTELLEVLGLYYQKLKYIGGNERERSC